ncbi:MAG TPA: hypothetical protein VMZ30_11280 [Pyrinomonadaceae bacterium]|nr:hypothetical protein [Pyrinomonadaceae bacterium]
MKTSGLLVVIFFGLCLLATLFPPFLWGEELFQQEDISFEYKLQLSQSGGLPVKKYAFLFGASKQRLYSGVWLWNESEGRSGPFYLAVQRRLLVSELLLEYVLAFIIAFISAFLMALLRLRIFPVVAKRETGNDPAQKSPSMSSDNEPLQREALNEVQMTLTSRLLLLLSCGGNSQSVESWKEQARASGLSDARVDLLLADCRAIQESLTRP